MELLVLGHHLKLSPERAIYLQSLDAILIADVHFGKTTHFRKAGIAVPTDIIYNEIKRLQLLIDEHQPKKLYFLGDLFHSQLNHEWQMLMDFMASNSAVEFILVKGNHDILSEDNYKHPNFEMVKEPVLLDHFVLSHHPINPDVVKINKQQLFIYGHIHPGVKVKGKARSYFNLPCFHFQKNQLVLPAFGRFTGLGNIKPKKDDKVFAIANESIIEIK